MSEIGRIGRFCILLSLCTSSSLVPAETGYIRDTLYVPLRGGQSQQHLILHRGIKSGTRLELLEKNPETGFSRVRMEDGLEGWLPTQYISAEPTAQILLQETRVVLQALQTDYASAKEEIKSLRTAATRLKQTNDAVNAKSQALANELNRITRLAANVMEIDSENKGLITENESLKDEIDALAQANQSLHQAADREWFLIGAGTILLGLLFGFWLSRRIYHRHSSSGWT